MRATSLGRVPFPEGRAAVGSARGRTAACLSGGSLGRRVGARAHGHGRDPVFFSDSASDEAKAFREAFRKEHSGDPDTWAALTYDALGMAGEGLAESAPTARARSSRRRWVGRSRAESGRSRASVALRGGVRRCTRSSRGPSPNRPEPRVICAPQAIPLRNPHVLVRRQDPCLPASSYFMSALLPCPDVELVQVLLLEQFPAWAHLPVLPCQGGTDHALFRLGQELAVRLPLRVDSPAPDPSALEQLGPLLPVAAPERIARGAPSPRFPAPWSVVRWVPGTPANEAERLDGDSVALALAAVVRAIRGATVRGRTPSHYRGGPLSERDAVTRAPLGALASEPWAPTATSLWEQALALPPYEGPPRWFHGDLHPANVILDGQGQLAGILDFDAAASGDPAIDALPAWWLFAGDAGRTFVASVDLDDAALARGRGWALSIALVALPYHRPRTPAFAALAAAALQRVLRDFEAGSALLA